MYHCSCNFVSMVSAYSSMLICACIKQAPCPCTLMKQGSNYQYSAACTMQGVYFEIVACILCSTFACFCCQNKRAAPWSTGLMTSTLVIVKTSSLVSLHLHKKFFTMAGARSATQLDVARVLCGLSGRSTNLCVRTCMLIRFRRLDVDPFWIFYCCTF